MPHTKKKKGKAKKKRKNSTLDDTFLFLKKTLNAEVHKTRKS